MNNLLAFYSFFHINTIIIDKNSIYLPDMQLVVCYRFLKIQMKRIIVDSKGIVSLFLYSVLLWSSSPSQKQQLPWIWCVAFQFMFHYMYILYIYKTILSNYLTVLMDTVCHFALCLLFHLIFVWIQNSHLYSQPIEDNMMFQSSRERMVFFKKTGLHLPMWLS